MNGTRGSPLYLGGDTMKKKNKQTNRFFFSATRLSLIIKIPHPRRGRRRTESHYFRSAQRRARRHFFSDFLSKMRGWGGHTDFSAYLHIRPHAHPDM